ncbi:MAG: DMT family transporter [Kordiimonadaceae bacterium]|nr:DMT family transporter [Kordiimonadaceae bacterium]
MAAPRAPITMGAKEWGLLLTLSAIWGGGFLMVAISLEAFPPFTVVMFRIGLAALGLAVAVKVMGIGFKLPKTAPKNETLRAFALLAVFNVAVPFICLSWGQNRISTSLTSILYCSMPFFTVFLAHFMVSDERLTRRKLVGVLTGFAGVTAIIIPSAKDAIGGDILGQISVLCAPLSYGFSAVMARRYIHLGIHPLQMAAGQTVGAAFIFVPLALYVDQPWQLAAPGTHVWLALASLAFVATAFATVLYFRLLNTAGATNASLTTLFVPIFTIFGGVLFLGEVFSWAQALGMLIIGLGMVIMDGRLLAKVRSRWAAI